MTPLLYEITGLILAGGASRRMGRPKAQLRVGGQSLVQRVLGPLSAVCREVILVTTRPSDFLDLNLKIVQDLVPGQGPLGGLATGLFYARYPWALTLACDLPFLKPELLAFLAQEALAAPPGPRAVVPRLARGWELLVAAYSRACLPAARALLAQGRLRLEDLVDRGVPFQAVPEEELRARDQDLGSFLNLNTPADLARARARAGSED